MRLVEARVRPEDHPGNFLRSTPLEHGLDEGAAGAAASQPGVEVETMELGGTVVQPLDTNRADDRAAFTHDEEGAMRRRIVLIESIEVGDLDLGHVHEAIFQVHAADELDDAGHVRASPEADRQRAPARASALVHHHAIPRQHDHCDPEKHERHPREPQRSEPLAEHESRGVTADERHQQGERRDRRRRVPTQEPPPDGVGQNRRDHAEIQRGRDRQPRSARDGPRETRRAVQEQRERERRQRRNETEPHDEIEHFDLADSL